MESGHVDGVPQARRQIVEECRAVDTRDVMRPLAISMPTTSSMSAVHKIPPTLRSPFGPLRPVTHFALTTRPSGVSREM